MSVVRQPALVTHEVVSQIQKMTAQALNSLLSGGIYRNVPKVAVSCAYLLESASQSGTYLFAKNQRFDGSRKPVKLGTWRSIPYHLASLGNPP
jgi:hypothetical protein